MTYASDQFLTACPRKQEKDERKEGKKSSEDVREGQ